MQSLQEKKFTYIVAVIIGLFVIYTVFSSYGSILPYQWAMVFALLFVSAILYIVIDRGMLGGAKREMIFIFLLYVAAGLILFYPTIDNVFRSDYWIRVTGFNPPNGFSWETVKDIVVFEFLGSKRFQPFAHLVLLGRHLILGYNVIGTHLLNILLHVITASLIFLTLRRFSGNAAFSFIFGLIFIALQSQFDIVSWSFHLYIMIGAIFFLVAFLLTLVYLDSRRSVYLLLALLLALLSIFLYEAAIIAPAAVFLVVLFHGNADGDNGRRGRLILVGSLALAAYIIYLLVTLYGLSLIEQGEKFSFSALVSWRGLILAVKGVAINLWQTTFILNSGVSALIDISSIVFVDLPEKLFGSFTNIIKIVLSLFIVSMFRLKGKSWRIVPILLIVALSYIFIISFGRMQTNSIYYLVTQPRYQYFINAVLIVVVGMLLWHKYQQRELRLLMVIALSAVFFWNSQNTIHANNRVAEEISYLDTPYYRIKDFLDQEPDARVFIDHVPFNKKRFFLGSDIALDLLLDKGLTRFPSRATHIYNGESFIENPAYTGYELPAELGDFMVSWAYMGSEKTPAWLNVVVVGSEESYPRFSVTQDGFVMVEMLNARTGKLDTYRLSHPYATIPGYSSYVGWSLMKVIKDGSRLCLYFNGVLSDTVTIKESYSQWTADASGLHGDYYLGRGGAGYVSNLFVEAGNDALECD